jgi:hypothetical protein
LAGLPISVAWPVAVSIKYRLFGLVPASLPAGELPNRAPGLTITSPTFVVPPGTGAKLPERPLNRVPFIVTLAVTVIFP